MIIVLDPGIGIVNDTINEAEQEFAIILELAEAVDPARVDLMSQHFVTIMYNTVLQILP